MVLSEELNQVVFLVNLKTNDIHEVFCTHESRSGNTVLTEYGQLLRTDTKHQKVFYQYDFARLVVKQNKGETSDTEYDEILKRLELRKITRKAA
jgi:hypothetical protein